jgi:hypothetical protein
MAENQFMTLLLAVLTAYLLVTYWKKILFVLAIVVVTAFCFGICQIVESLDGTLASQIGTHRR